MSEEVSRDELKNALECYLDNLERLINMAWDYTVLSVLFRAKDLELSEEFEKLASKIIELTKKGLKLIDMLEVGKDG